MELIPETENFILTKPADFSVISSYSNKYIIIVYVYDENAIIFTPMKNNTK